MAQVETSITINAPVEKVFAYVDDPANLLEIWPSLVDVRDVERLPSGGSKFSWTYKMAGVRIGGVTEAVESITNRALSARVKAASRAQSPGPLNQRMVGQR